MGGCRLFVVTDKRGGYGKGLNVGQRNQNSPEGRDIHQIFENQHVDGPMCFWGHETCAHGQCEGSQQSCYRMWQEVLLAAVLFRYPVILFHQGIRCVSERVCVILYIRGVFLSACSGQLIPRQREIYRGNMQLREDPSFTDKKRKCLKLYTHLLSPPCTFPPSITNPT